MSEASPTPDWLRRELAARFGVPSASARVARAPYRVCPLGAHVDHQRGPATAMAIDRGVLLAYAPSPSRQVRIASLDFPGAVAFSLDEIPPARPDDWGNFARGAARALLSRHRLDRGIVGLASGKLHGGGVSSSAAMGVALLLALEDANRLTISPAENIELDRRIENDYLGLRNGILDPAAVLLSRKGYLTAIDCRTAAHELIPPPSSMPRFRILLAFSGLRRQLVGTDYNRRVAECADAARILMAADGRVASKAHGSGHAVLGDVGRDVYEAYKGLLRDAPARRAAHFFAESDRVRRGIAAWRRGDLAEFGDLMTASGESSIRNYECGSPPLIDLYQILAGTKGVHGARFSGAGFRGCCVALVEPSVVGAVAERVSAAYAELHPDLADQASIVACESDDGASILDDAENGPPARPVGLIPATRLP